MSKKSVGWKNKRPDDPERHAAASRGIKTGNKRASKRASSYYRLPKNVSDHVTVDGKKYDVEYDLGAAYINGRFKGTVTRQRGEDALTFIPVERLLPSETIQRRLRKKDAKILWAFFRTQGILPQHGIRSQD